MLLLLAEIVPTGNVNRQGGNLFDRFIASDSVGLFDRFGISSSFWQILNSAECWII
ncbi:hypothetical protein [Bacillus sp. ISL-57]|uniref:hypothetical protein n=1 Tax=Bacillus sp. ISL-57 TaxID=2819135 RepID=UPI001BED2FA2|nr:hypothetical protein [Bacillus sp. ISL-57]